MHNITKQNMIHRKWLFLGNIQFSMDKYLFKDKEHSTLLFHYNLRIQGIE